YGNTHSAYTKEALHRGYANILWSNSSADTATHSAQVVYDNITQNIHPGDIVLMHDSDDKQHTANALPRVIKYLKKAGYSFVTVPQMLKELSAPLPPKTVKTATNTKQARR